MKATLSRDASPRSALSDPDRRVSRAGRRADREPLQPDPDLAQWCAALAQITTPVDVVPPGWHSAKAIAEKLKLPKATLKPRLRALLDSGACECRMFRVRLKQLTRPVPHYKLK